MHPLKANLLILGTALLVIALLALTGCGPARPAAENGSFHPDPKATHCAGANPVFFTL